MKFTGGWLKVIKKFFNRIRLFFVGLFYGMKSADMTVLKIDDNSSEDNEVNHTIFKDNVMNDVIHEQETQRFRELRDAYYRLLFEADKYSVEMTFDEEGGLTGAKSYKNNGKWIKAPDNIDNPDGLRVRVIQENYQITRGSNFNAEELLKTLSVYDFLTTLELYYSDIVPRYQLNKYVKKIVVLGEPNDTTLELYISKYQEEYNKIHALFLSEINRIMTNEDYKSDILSFDRAGFITDGHTWGTSISAVFSFENIKYQGIREYDGSYILSFRCTTIKDGESVGEKYKTKELDEKYATKAQKHDTYMFDAAETAYNREKILIIRIPITNLKKIHD